jgi:hypothetical protein
MQLWNDEKECVCGCMKPGNKDEKPNPKESKYISKKRR